LSEWQIKKAYTCSKHANSSSFKSKQILLTKYDMKNSIITAGIFVALILTAGISSGQSQSRETRNEGDFEKVVFGIKGELIINFGHEHRIIIEGQQSVPDEIETKVTNGRLLIMTKRPGYFKNDEEVVVRITMPEIESLSVSGSGNCNCRINESLEAVILGSGNINYRGNPKIDSKVTGSGRIISAR
jgi:hypothetical protein